MGHCNIEVKKDTSVKMAEKPIETKPKEKVNNNTYEYKTNPKRLKMEQLKCQ